MSIFHKYNEVFSSSVMMFFLLDGNYLEANFTGYADPVQRAVISSDDKIYDERLGMICLLTFMSLVSNCVWYCRLYFMNLCSWRLTMDLTLLRFTQFIWWSRVTYMSVGKSSCSWSLTAFMCFLKLCFSQCFVCNSFSMTILLVHVFSLGLCCLIDKNTLAKVGIKPSPLRDLINFMSNVTFWNFVFSVSKDLTMSTSTTSTTIT